MMLSYFDAENRLNLCTLAEAVEMECVADIPDAGQMEANTENLLAMSQMLGRVLTYLHESGVIPEDIILDQILLGGYDKCER